MMLMIEGRREAYSPEQIGDTMTVRELIDYLEQFDDDTKVLIDNDNGYTYGSITCSSFKEDYEDYEDDEDDEEE